MSIAENEEAHRVRFGATVSAIARAFRFAAPAILITWGVYFGIHALPVILELAKVTIPRLPFGPPGWTTGLPITVATAVTSGLFIRWLLVRTPDALRPDGRLAAYVGLLVLAFLIDSFVLFALMPDLRGRTTISQSVGLIGRGVVSLLIDLVLAFLVLWPVGLLVGDRLSPGQAIARMRQAILTFIGVYLLLGVPPVLIITGRMIVSRAVRLGPGERLANLALSSVIGTLAFVLLAQVYSRRIRGCDLGQDPPGALADVFE